jgi:hypothetical protein
LDKDVRNLWYSPILLISHKGYVDVIRTFKDIKEHEYVEFFAKINIGDKIKLSFATAEMLLEEDKKVAKKLKDKMAHPDVVFNFSCVAREYVLNSRQKDEVLIYSQVFNAPLFGFFTYGEIGPDKELTTSKVYNQTSLVAILKEK